MNYNEFSYYRSNPYHKMGNIPPVGHKNRMPQQFPGQMPQGEDHLERGGRKRFKSIAERSSIQQENIMNTPERYPYQHRIAFDKNYMRTLNTIDIEGAKSGTMVSEAVRNKMKAQLQLERQRKQRQLSTQQQKMQHYLIQQDEQRRELAMRQYKKNKQLSELIGARNSPNLYKEQVTLEKGRLQNFHQRNQSAIQQNNPLQTVTTKLEPTKNNQQMKTKKQAIRRRNSEYDSKIDPYSNRQFQHNQSGVQKMKEDFNQYYQPGLPHLNDNRYNNNNNKMSPLNKSNDSFTDRRHNESGITPQNDPDRYNYKYDRRSYSPMKSDQFSTILTDGNMEMVKSKDLRKMNPTHLSSPTTSMSLAGRNIVRY